MGPVKGKVLFREGEFGEINIMNSKMLGKKGCR